MARKILITDNVNGIAAEILAAKGYEVDQVPTLKGEDLIKKIDGYSAIIVRSATKITREVLDSAPDLRVIGRAGAGLDNIDLPAAKERNIRVINTPNAHAVSVAEHVMALMLAVTRNIPKADKAMKEGKWIKKQLKSNEIRGKKLGIIGFGNVGQEVASRAISFGMKVYTYDVVAACNEISEEMGCEVTLDLDSLLPDLDYLTLHVPYNKYTHHLINSGRLGVLKTGCIIINTSRGKVIDQEALVDVLKSGKVRGAGLDVFREEPVKPEDPILKLDNVVLTPHIASSTAETQILAAKTVAEEISQELL
ncbi:MAG: hydroxyacid dehydrogenase [Promethearchaeota archaeon]